MDLLETEKIEELHAGGFRIMQDERFFKFGVDAVLLADFARTGKNELVCDLCTGNAIIPILMCAKNPSIRVKALEIQEGPFMLAEKSVAINGLGERIETVCGDLKKSTEIFGKSVFDSVTVNPPYEKINSGKENINPHLNIARNEICCTLADVIHNSSQILKPRGKLFMIHKPSRLGEIFALMHENRLEPKRMRLVTALPDSKPTMVLVEAVKFGKPFMEIEKNIAVYKSKGIFSDEMDRIYCRDQVPSLMP